MSRVLIVHECGPGTSVQDLGRFGYLAYGASQGGAADIDAVYEGAALLAQDPGTAVLELVGIGGRFSVSEPTRIALTGAPMAAKTEQPLAWNGSHLLMPGDTLHLGHAQRGNYSYLHVGGGIATPAFLGSRSTHLVARIGAPVQPGRLPIGPDTGDAVGLTLATGNDRFGGGTIRIIESAQTGRFSDEDLRRLQQTTFARDPRGNRMGARMVYNGAPFAPDGGLSLLSEMVVPGDIQIAGDGTPFVLLGECQTTGGYPRIGTVIPPDLPCIAQARAGEPIRFQMITRTEALRRHAAHRAQLDALAPVPRLRDPHDMNDLLSYQLISGAVTGDEP